MWAVRGSEQVRYLHTTGNTCISNIVPKFKKKECFNKTHSSLLSVCRFSNSVFKFGLSIKKNFEIQILFEWYKISLWFSF